ncbi:exopolyphosphatase [Fistulifera solaris]|uniref:Exopolyphosphatase n=1 Tax=Fistulifera solaris TaxID=1519565 RepID=A0A1Z5JS16_FISSO|nr:exopolyphosphatase [Fistulifera solaris]|eukprot:GAX16820.1 exopolyphosphatase [Fistulifera solaris]
MLCAVCTFSYIAITITRYPFYFLKVFFVTTSKLDIICMIDIIKILYLVISLVHRSSSAWCVPRSTHRFFSRSLAAMKTSDESLSAFLKKRRDSPTNHLVIGNKAGDADSIVSALAAAYLDDATPVISIRQNDLRTQRPEAMLLFKIAGLEISDLWFADQLNFLAAEPVSLTLVDHNRLDAPALEQGSHFVKAIYDHHMDEGHHKDSATIRNIAFSDKGEPTVASTCTLMVEKMEGTKLPADLSLLLLGVILIDSVNLSPNAGKVTPRDEAAVQKLLKATNWQELDLDGSICGDSPLQPSTSLLFDALQNAKFDPLFWNPLPVEDALRLDFKIFQAGDETFGISSVLLSAKNFLDKEHAINSIEAFMERLQIKFFVIMFAYAKDSASSLTRELLLCGKDASEVYAWLEREGSLQLSFREQLLDRCDQPVIVLDQGNVKASRKIVAPILIQYFQTRK